MSQLPHWITPTVVASEPLPSWLASTRLGFDANTRRGTVHQSRPKVLGHHTHSPPLNVSSPLRHPKTVLKIQE